MASGQKGNPFAGLRDTQGVRVPTFKRPFFPETAGVTSLDTVSIAKSQDLAASLESGPPPGDGQPTESARRRAWKRARARESEARRILAIYFPKAAELDLPCEVLSFTRERIVFELGGSTYDLRRPKDETT
jgi:hypothetical protein